MVVEAAVEADDLVVAVVVEEVEVVVPRVLEEGLVECLHLEESLHLVL